ncbi:hypothetical protein VPHK394_0066 [Vibrio phage K394]
MTNRNHFRPIARRSACKDCWTLAEVNHLGLCKQCASDPNIVNEKLKSKKITKEIRDGLPGFYKSLRGE